MPISDQWLESSWERPSGVQSKQRRDSINQEINNLRDLIPLSTASRNRLSQLQLMAIVCTDFRRHVRFSRAFSRCYKTDANVPTSFSEALDSAILICTREGKLLHLAGNLQETLGENFEDLISNGDNFLDMLNPMDRQRAQFAFFKSSVIANSGVRREDDRIFVTRLATPKNARRSGRSTKSRVILVRGCFLTQQQRTSKVMTDFLEKEDIFLGTCQPLLTPETHKLLLAINPNMFVTVHKADMVVVGVNSRCQELLGWSANQIVGCSWYKFIHGDYLAEASGNHRSVISAEIALSPAERQSRICLLKIMCSSGQWKCCLVLIQTLLPGESAFYLKLPFFNFAEDVGSLTPPNPVDDVEKLVCFYQFLSEEDATVIAGCSWLFEPPKRDKLVDVPVWIRKSVRPVGKTSHGKSSQLKVTSRKRLKAPSNFLVKKAIPSSVAPVSPISSVASLPTTKFESCQSPEQNVPVIQPNFDMEFFNQLCKTSSLDNLCEWSVIQNCDFLNVI